MRRSHFSSARSGALAPRRWRLPAALPLLVLLAALQSTSWSQDAYSQSVPLDPPGQVARLSLAQGAVSFAPADAVGASDSNGWTTALLNRPLTLGDRLWTGPNARAELHAGSTAVRMSKETSLDFLALNDSVIQLRLSQGTMQLRVRALFEGQRLEVDTPNLAFVIAQPGDYRVDVDPAAGTTRVVAQSGGGTIYGDRVSLALGSPQQGNFSGAGLTPAAPGSALQDSFDAWAAERDRREDQSVAARYIPRETIGYQQLDGYGDWQQDPAYGAVWLPRAVPIDWAPYRAGHWSWISPWGWTWVDDAPWGFAPFHYGRWAQIGPRWAWVPGLLPQRPVYAPALVAFVNWRGAARPALGWFPLAPGEAFRPAYRSSPSYVSRVNNNITVSANNLYRYQHQPAAVTALSRDDFAHRRQVQGRPYTPSAADLSGAQVLADHSALPQRLERPDPVAPVPPVARMAPLLAPDRNAFEAEQRARRDQQFLQREQERQHLQIQREQQLQQLQQSDVARQQEMLRQQAHEQQRRQTEEVLNRQLAMQEQARQQMQQKRAAVREHSRPQAQVGQLAHPPEVAHRRSQRPEGGPQRRGGPDH